MYQAVPEMVIDTYACVLEIHGGLSAQYASYWKGQKGYVLLLKFSIAVVLTAFALGVSIVVV